MAERVAGLLLHQSDQIASSSPIGAGLLPGDSSHAVSGLAPEQVFELARPAGFEPATRCLEGSCSVRLSYGRSKRNCARRRSRDGYTKVAVCRSLTPCHLGKRQAASRRGLPNRRGYLTMPSGVELLQPTS